MLRRWLAGQYARPSGRLGRLLIGPWLDRLSRGMNAKTLKALDPRPGETVVEAGFGGGALLADLLDAGCEVVGVDPSAAMLARGRRRFAKALEARRLRLLEGSAQAMPLADATIHKACSVNTLYFWSDPAVAMAEFARILRPGGWLVLCFQSADQVRAWPGHVHGFSAYEEEEVARWMREAGFVSVGAKRGSDPKLGDFVCMTGLREPA